MAYVGKGKANSRRMTADLRALGVDELKKKLAETRERLMRDRFRHASASLEDTASLKSARRQIARMETVLNEKINGAAKNERS